MNERQSSWGNHLADHCDGVMGVPNLDVPQVTRPYYRSDRQALRPVSKGEDSDSWVTTTSLQYTQPFTYGQAPHAKPVASPPSATTGVKKYAQ